MDVGHTKMQDSIFAQPQAARRARAMDGPSEIPPPYYEVQSYFPYHTFFIWLTAAQVFAPTKPAFTPSMALDGPSTIPPPHYEAHNYPHYRYFIGVTAACLELSRVPGYRNRPWFLPKARFTHSKTFPMFLSQKCRTAFLHSRRLPEGRGWVGFCSCKTGIRAIHGTR